MAVNRLFLWLAFTCLFFTNTFAQQDSVRYQMVEEISKDILKYYVSTGLAIKMSNLIKYNFKMNFYDESLNIDEFTFEITKDLRKISGDYHINIRAPFLNEFDQQKTLQESDKLSIRQWRKRMKKVKNKEREYAESLEFDMFTYGEIKILQGNIGYLEIKDFNSKSMERKNSKKRVSLNSVFKFLSKADDIVLDLRENSGGLSNLGAKFCSFFSKEVSSYFITNQSFLRYDSGGIEKTFSSTNKYYTDSDISNSATKGKRIYILISSRTFSTAELVAYKIKRFIPETVIIGEKTKGGGNGYSEILYRKYYSAIIPSIQSFDESNNNNDLEGKGVLPDIFCNADSAFDVAIKMLSEERNVETPKNKELIFFKKKASNDNNSGFKRFYPDYIGNYRKLSIYEDKGRLYMLYDGFKKNLLISTKTKDFFEIEDFMIIEFIRIDSSNQVIEIVVKHKSGYLERFKKQ